jgi:hypothetical protein
MSGPLPGLTGFHRITHIPGPPRDERAPDDAARQVRQLRQALIPALAGAHAASRTVAVAWVHPAVDADLHLLVSGLSDASAGNTPGVPMYPPGAGGLRIDDADVAGLLGRLPAWTRLPGRFDALNAPPPHGGAELHPGALFDDYASALLDIPFAWLVVAEPLGHRDVEARIRNLSRQAPRLREMSAGAEHQRLAARQAEEALRETVAGAVLGMWHLHVLAAGPDPAGVRRVAGLLAAAADTTDFPYMLRADTSVFDLPGAWQAATGTQTDDQDASPFLGSTPLLAALARPPVKEVRGLRVPPSGEFDVTPEHTTGIRLGTVLDRSLRPTGPFRVSQETLNRHVFVCGATGSGKSQTVRGLLEQLHSEGIPWLVIEPAKAEYARMAGRIAPDGDVLVIRPGQPDVPAAGLNPLQPEAGFPLQTHIDLLRALFLAAFQQQDPMPQVLTQALTRCYQTHGWDLTLGEPRHAGPGPYYPTLTDLRTAALAVVNDIGYGKEVADNIRGFVDVRINSLRMGTPGRFFEGGHPLDLAALMRRNTVLELEDIGNDQDKAFFIGNVLIHIVEHLRTHRGAPHGACDRLRHVTVVEEAHRLLKATSADTPAAHAVDLFTGLLAEIRAYGEGIVIAEQIPSKIAPDVVKNTALKIMHRLPSQDDRDFVGAAMNLSTPNSSYVVTLPPGQAAAFTDGMDRPLLVRMDSGEDRESTPRHPQPAPMAGSRSITCGSLCRTRPCTPREIHHALAASAADAELALWIETMTAAHVLGYPEPVPREDWLRKLTAATDRRTLECAIGHLTHQAVLRRYPALIEHYQPESLAEHLTDRATARIDGDHSSCDGAETHWQAGIYRWRDVFDTLTAADHDPTLPHPLTDQWRARGLDLGDLPATGQLINLQRLPGTRTADRTAVDGAGHPPEHQRLSALLSRPADPMQRFMEATGFLTFSNAWALHRLYPQEWEKYLKRSHASGGKT